MADSSIFAAVAEKQGGGTTFMGRKNWKARYIVVDTSKSTIAYYDTEAAYKGKQDPKKPPISLMGHVLDVPADADAGFFMFTLKAEDKASGRKELGMRASTKEVRDNFAKALSRAGVKLVGTGAASIPVATSAAASSSEAAPAPAAPSLDPVAPTPSAASRTAETPVAAAAAPTATAAADPAPDSARAPPPPPPVPAAAPPAPPRPAPAPAAPVPAPAPAASADEAPAPPNVPKPAPPAEAPAPGATVNGLVIAPDGKPLPAGWQWAANADGYVYFIMPTGESTWDRPEAPIVAV